MDAWHAVAEPTRRRILLLLASGESTAGEIADQFTSTRSAVSQHLAVLRAADLVEVTAQGRRRVYRLNRRTMEQLRAEIETFWTTELGSLARQAQGASTNVRNDDERSAG